MKDSRVKRRLFLNHAFKYLFLAMTMTSILFLAVLLVRIISQGTGYLNFDFLRNNSAPFPEEAGLFSGIIGSLYLMLLIAPITLIVGVGTAFYTTEYSKDNKFTRFIQVNIQNLAGVPSIIYGLLGLTFFVHILNLGYTLISGVLTMSLLILPIIIVSSQESINALPKEIKEASIALGATKWQTIWKIVLPAALPGILTGSILALSRAIGETAPLIIVGAATAIYTLPSSLMSRYTAMPIQIYNWTSRPQEEWQFVAGAGIIVLLVILLLMNTIAIVIRNKYQSRY